MDEGTVKAAARSAAKVSSLSLDALDKRLGIRKRAREDAARGLPALDAATLSPTEEATLSALRTTHAELDAAALATAAEAERRLRGLAPSPQDFAGPVLDAKLAMKQVGARLEHDWRAVAERAAHARADLDAFKRAHDLRRAAVYPKSTLLQAGLLLCAALFESLFSAALFAEDDERGLLGGAITAIGLSGANVTLGYLAGFLGLRYLQHRRWPMRTAGALGFGAMAALALMLNLFAADWRDQLALLAGRQLDMGSDADFHIWSLLQLESPQAIILLMLGAGVWVFAALKGFSGFDDPYPDFGKMDRAATSAADSLADFRADALEDLEAPLNTARETLAKRLDAMRAQFDAMSRAFDESTLALEDIAAEARGLEKLVASAIQLYRTENAAARAGDAPAYFAAPAPTLERASDPLGPAAALIDAARASIAQAQAQSAAGLESLLLELQSAAARLEASPGA